MNRVHYRNALIIILLTAAVWSLYAPVLRHEFVNYDDEVYVSMNPNVRHGLTLESVRWALTGTVSSLWHPVTMLSHMLDVEIFGMNPAGHHFTNVLFHHFNVILLFLLLQTMTGAPWRSAFVAAFFAVHPINVDTVAWVAERKNVLSTFFWFAAIAAYIFYTRRTTRGRYFLVFVLIALGLMSKPMLVTAPLTLLLLDYWPLRRDGGPGAGLQPWKDLVIDKIPLLVLTVALSLATVRSQGAEGALASTRHFPIVMRLTYVLDNYVHYLKSCFWPYGLSVIYPPPTHALTATQLTADLTVLTFLTGAALFAIRRFRPLTMGWFWYVVVLAPVCGILASGTAIKADRFVYVPLLGIFIIIVWGAMELVRNNRILQKAMVGAGLAALFTLGTIAHRQIGYWQNSLMLFQHAIDVTRDNYTAQLNIGVAEREANRMPEALFHFEEAVRIDPRGFSARNNLGIMLRSLGRVDEAISNFTMAITFNPRSAKAFFNLGEIMYDRGDPEKAIRLFQAGLEREKKDPRAWQSLGNIFGDEGDYVEALKCYEKALALDPIIQDALVNSAYILTKQGRRLEAVERLETACKIYPKNLEPLKYLALIRAGSPEPQLRNPLQAIQLAKKAVALAGTNSAAYQGTLAAAYAANGQFPEAVDAIRQQLEWAEQGTNLHLVMEIKRRLDSYQSGVPFVPNQSPSSSLPIKR